MALHSSAGTIAVLVDAMINAADALMRHQTQAVKVRTKATRTTIATKVDDRALTHADTGTIHLERLCQTTGIWQPLDRLGHSTHQWAGLQDRHRLLSCSSSSSSLVPFRNHSGMFKLTFLESGKVRAASWSSVQNGTDLTADSGSATSNGSTCDWTFSKSDLYRGAISTPAGTAYLAAGTVRCCLPISF